ncbi:MAG: hypothetical protein M1821_002352 [Bathelium mastoideum]|nr:MAG: hypothetical protein M1821_002352 [Bathelium mastoideum]KAI9685691.1 MAG: hypothetical protein M1822_004251 [Bathelium mastoideum]
MKSTILLTTTVTLFAANAGAFPGKMDQLMGPVYAEAYKQKFKRQIDATAPQGTGALPLTPPPFDAAAQYISNQGAHAFVAPGATDQRGECPGLNAMANHNYLPHDGYATIQQFYNATQEVFGMSPDLSLFLATYGAVVDGPLTSWSIAGGPHIGIGGSHNNYESDSSPLKGDLNQYGSNSQLIMEQFNELYNMQPNASTANYNLEVLRTFRGQRLQESIDKNPYFAYLPFSGTGVSQAAFTFIYRFMANKSAEYPEGILNKDVLKSFMSIYGEEDNLTWVPGNERIPDNWYKRNPSDEYSIPYFVADILYFSETQPEISIPGCNKGTVDSFSPIDIAALTNGAYTAEQAAASPFCFAAEFALAELPLVTGLPLATLTSAIAPLTSILSGQNCQAIGSVNQSALTVCPGFSLYGGPTGPVAPGAVQS